MDSRHYHHTFTPSFIPSSTLQTSPNKDATPEANFKYWGQLPYDVRYQVWKYQLVPRIIKAESLFTKSCRELYIPILSTCQESRRIGLKYYSRYGCFHGPCHIPCYINLLPSMPATIPTDRCYEFGNPSTFGSFEALRIGAYEDFSPMRHYSYNYVDLKNDIIVINDTSMQSLLDFNLQFSFFHKLSNGIANLAIILPDEFEWDRRQIRRYLNLTVERILRGCHDRKHLRSLRVIFQKTALASHVLLDSAEGEDNHVSLKVKLLRALDRDYLRRSRPRKIRPPLLQFVRAVQAP